LALGGTAEAVPYPKPVHETSDWCRVLGNKQRSEKDVSKSEGMENARSLHFAPVGRAEIFSLIAFLFRLEMNV
jgi:hypothetical protein